MAAMQAGTLGTYAFYNDAGLQNLAGSIAFASLPTGSATANGAYVYCSDAKSVADGATAGSTAVGGGTGAFVFRQNGVWKIHG